VPWGEKAFGNYLGDDRERWKNWDAAELMQRRAYPRPILVDQGAADQFLTAQLQPQSLQAAAAVSGQALTLRMREGYDHSYWFVQTFIDDHLRHHAKILL
jgi:S-formylglutathione hydrolase